MHPRTPARCPAPSHRQARPGETRRPRPSSQSRSQRDGNPSVPLWHRPLRKPWGSLAQRAAAACAPATVVQSSSQNHWGRSGTHLQNCRRTFERSVPRNRTHHLPWTKTTAKSTRSRHPPSHTSHTARRLPCCNGRSATQNHPGFHTTSPPATLTPSPHTGPPAAYRPAASPPGYSSGPASSSQPDARDTPLRPQNRCTPASPCRSPC
mmetsp:Transcript_45318/g.103465  ORF Transcript_45318/g.103465 Transcript_45318/m.103465 type:complete len:208 (-) Transcript_45318:911-1534(-)